MDFSKVKAALEARQFEVSTFATAADAAKYLDAQIDGVTVSFGGSVTLKEIGVLELLAKHNGMSDFWMVPEGADARENCIASMTSDVYLTSVNGLAETGELINIDGTGNRVSGELFGHKKVYFVVGRNKIAPTYETALWRARNIASPKNAQRMGKNTPCVKGNRCFDCKSPERICRGLVVLWEKMKSCEMEVVLIDEDLGY